MDFKVVFMEKILDNLSSTLQTLKSRYARDNGGGGGGGGGGSTIGKRDHDDEMLGEKSSSDNDHNDHNDRTRSAVSGISSSLRKGWLRYPGWSVGYGRKKWIYHFVVRCVLFVVAVMVGLSIMDWVEQRRVIQAITGLRGLTPSQTEALKKRTWKKYFIYQGIRSLMVSMVLIIVLCLWMDPLTIP